MILENEKKYIYLDGKTSGILVEIVSAGDKRRYYTCKNGAPRIFANLNIAKIMSKSYLGEARLRFHIKFNKKTIPVDDCQCINGAYHYIDNKGNYYVIYESVIYKTINLGYISFEDGDTIRCDKKYGFKRQKELSKYIERVAEEILCINGTGDYNYSITSINRKSKEIIISIKGISGQIHICYNAKLMDINQARKEQGLAALPFLKQMDKFLTFYVYSTKDITESLKLNSVDKTAEVIDYIMELLVRYHDDLNPKYIPIDYPGYITLEENHD